jgi:hypothetical protein
MIKKTELNFILHEEFKITGISDIRIDNLTCDIDHQTLSFNVNFDLILPDVKGVGQYKIEGKAKIFPIRGRGQTILKLTALKTTVRLIGAYDDNKFTINTLEVTFDLNNVKFYFENFLHKNLSEFGNKLLSKIVKPLIYYAFFQNGEQMEKLKQRWKKSIEKELNIQVKVYMSSLQQRVFYF